MFERPWQSLLSVTRPNSWRTQSGIRTAGRKRHDRRPSLEVLENRLALTFVLGTTSLLEGAGSGTSSVIVKGSGGWSATSNVPWLQTSSVGVGNGVSVFRFEANTGVMRTGTLTIGGATLTVVQAGASYVEANPLTTLVSSGLNLPQGIAVDSAGNVYIGDWRGYALKEWNAQTQKLITLHDFPRDDGFQVQGVAVDQAGNVYVSLSDGDRGQLAEWNASTKKVTYLVKGTYKDPSILVRPQGLAVDATGNVFIADRNLGQIKEWNVATQSLSTVVASGLSGPNDVAVDAAGNLDIANYQGNSILQWNASTQSLKTVIAPYSGVQRPLSVAVDASGNIYIGDQTDKPIKEWNAATQTLTTLVSTERPDSSTPFGLAVDAAGNVYFDDFSNSFVKVLTRAFVPTGTISENAQSGADYTLSVLPVTQSLTGIFAPSMSNQSWLGVNGVSGGTGGAIRFSFTANTGAAPRSAQFTVLGKTITVTQQPALNISALFEGPAAGADSIVVNYAGDWTATANNSWLHTTSDGIGAGLATVTFDANPGGIRYGTLTIAGQTVNVTQAGNNYVAATSLTPVVSSQLIGPTGVAADASGNVVFADSGHNAIKMWNASTQTVSTLISSGLSDPRGVAVDGAGDIYIADTNQNRIKEWVAKTGTLITLVRKGLNDPTGVAVDAAGNVYIADTGNNLIQEWNVTTHALTTLVHTGLEKPQGVAVDGVGNVYIADTGHKAIKEWKASTRQVTTLISTGLTRPTAVSVDRSANVYIADSGNGAIKEWNALTGEVTTLASAPQLVNPSGVTVDGAGNVFIADTGNNAIKVLPRIFIPSNPFNESAAAGSDMLYPVVPTTASLTGVFAPSTDQGWLTITGVTDGVVRFAFTANNTGVDRTGHLIVLGQKITVTQDAPD